jgi:hypothetical protein
MADNYDVFKMANSLSHTQSSDIDKALITSSNVNFLQDEISAGVDRSRSSIGYSVQLNWLEQISQPSANAMDIEVLTRSLAEIIVRIAQPSNLLFYGMNYILGSTFRQIVPSVKFVNNISLDYVERFSELLVDDADVINMADFASGNFGDTFDLIFVDLELVSHDFQIIDNAWNHLNAGGVMFLNIVNDFGSLYSLKNQHPYFHYLSRLTDDEDKYVFHIPVATGFTLVVKK